MPTFTIEIRTHGGAVEETITNPTGLSWKYQIGALGPGTIEFSVAESDTVVLGLDGTTTMPYKRDFLLKADGVPLMGGFLSSVNMPLSGDEVHFSGVDWSKWLDQSWRYYYTPPMDYFDDVDAIIALDDSTELEVFFDPTLATVTDWVDNILAPISEDAGEQVILSPSYSGGVWAELLGGRIARSPNLTVKQLLDALASMGDPYGFDYWVDFDKVLNLAGPRRTDPGGIFPIATFTRTSGEIIDGDWTNNGPLGTDILFLDGQGNASRYYRKQHAASVAEFRRWGADTTIEGGDTDHLTFGTGTELEFKAAASSYRMMFPQRELTLQVKPEFFTFSNRLLEAIAVNYSKFPGSFRTIDASFWITSQTYSENSPGSGDWVCDLTLDQIYSPI